MMDVKEMIQLIEAHLPADKREPVIAVLRAAYGLRYEGEGLIIYHDAPPTYNGCKRRFMESARIFDQATGEPSLFARQDPNPGRPEA